MCGTQVDRERGRAPAGTPPMETRGLELDQRESQRSITADPNSAQLEANRTRRPKTDSRDVVWV